MTILEAQNLILAFFAKNDVFEMSKLKEVILVSENYEYDTAALIGALNNLENDKIIVKIELKKTFYFILRQPWSSFSQAVSISPNLSIMVADFINKYLFSIGDRSSFVSAAELKEKDFLVLLALAQTNMGKQESK